MTNRPWAIAFFGLIAINIAGAAILLTRQQREAECERRAEHVAAWAESYMRASLANIGAAMQGASARVAAPDRSGVAADSAWIMGHCPDLARRMTP